MGLIWNSLAIPGSLIQFLGGEKKGSINKLENRLGLKTPAKLALAEKRLSKIHQRAFMRSCLKQKEQISQEILLIA